MKSKRLRKDTLLQSMKYEKFILISDKVSHFIVLLEGKEKTTIGSVEIFENIITKELLK